jgi:type IV secretion system protein VirB5
MFGFRYFISKGINKVKNKLLVLALSSVLSAPSMASGIPVIDVASLAQQITQVTNMVQQLQALQTQIQTAESQLNNISGARGLGSFINTNYDTAVEYSEGQIFTDNGLKTASQRGVDPAFSNIYDKGNQNAAQRLGRSQKTLNQATSRYDRLMPLIAKINDSPDQKDILDLSARIQAESVLLQNELIKLEAMKAESAAKDAIHRRQVTDARLSTSGTNNKDYTGDFD